MVTTEYVNGQEALKPKERNSSYSKEFKDMVVQDYVQNGLSPYELATKYNIPSKTVIDQWIKRYNNHIEQRDYCPHQEVYMVIIPLDPLIDDCFTRNIVFCCQFVR